MIALGFAAAIAIVPVAAGLSSEHSPSGYQRSVAECLPFTEICWPDPPPLLGPMGEPAPVATPAPAPPPLVNDDPIPPEDPPVNMGGVARVVY